VAPINSTKRGPKAQNKDRFESQNPSNVFILQNCKQTTTASGSAMRLYSPPCSSCTVLPCSQVATKATGPERYQSYYRTYTDLFMYTTSNTITLLLQTQCY